MFSRDLNLALEKLLNNNTTESVSTEDGRGEARGPRPRQARRGERPQSHGLVGSP